MEFAVVNRLKDDENLTTRGINCNVWLTSTRRFELNVDLPENPAILREDLQEIKYNRIKCKLIQKTLVHGPEKVKDIDKHWLAQQ